MSFCACVCVSGICLLNFCLFRFCFRMNVCIQVNCLSLRCVSAICQGDRMYSSQLFICMCVCVCVYVCVCYLSVRRFTYLYGHMYRGCRTEHNDVLKSKIEFRRTSLDLFHCMWAVPWSREVGRVNVCTLSCPRVHIFT